MKFALLSDIHGNYPALEAVLRDAWKNGVEKFVVLGDVVGYGPFPRECVRWTDAADVVLMGNHDAAVAGLVKTDFFNHVAALAIEWTRSVLSSADMAKIMKFRERVEHYRIGDVEFSAYHGAPSDPFFTYVFSLGIAREQSWRTRLNFVGHTHIPAIFMLNPDKELLSPDENFFLSFKEIERHSCVVVNPGSVGQSRDGDPRAHYAVVNDDGIIWRRVEYDINKTAHEIVGRGLPVYLAERLYFGY